MTDTNWVNLPLKKRKIPLVENPKLWQNNPYHWCTAIYWKLCVANRFLFHCLFRNCWNYCPQFELYFFFNFKHVIYDTKRFFSYTAHKHSSVWYRTYQHSLFRYFNFLFSNNFFSILNLWLNKKKQQTISFKFSCTFS